MKGHDALIAERMDGRAPVWVFVNDYPCKTDWSKWGDVPTICTHGDNLAKLDFRFLVGLKVNVTSPSEARAKELLQRFKAAGAKWVAAGHIQDDKPLHEQDGWLQIYRKEDLNG